jgi:cell cycle sensor histidine kinase DivJ
MSDVITRHGRNGVVTFISPAAERLLGVTPAVLMGHNLFERVHVADRPNFLSALIEASRGHTTSVEYRLRQGVPGGDTQSHIWVESRCHALESGAETGEVVAVTRDITRRKIDAEALEAARREAERANAAKSRFLATVSHELRTPLNAIVGFSEMLTNETSHSLDVERRADYARVIRDSGQHLLAVVNGILDVSRIEAGHFELNLEPFAVGPLVESCYEMMLLRAEQAGVRFDLEIARDLPEVVADQLAVRQVLINLLANAV